MTDPKSRQLVLHLKEKYFKQIKAGKKDREYRGKTPYWIKRLVGKTFDEVLICNKYPALDDPENVLRYPWSGYEETPDNYFAIILKGPAGIPA